MTQTSPFLNIAALQQQYYQSLKTGQQDNEMISAIKEILGNNYKSLHISNQSLFQKDLVPVNYELDISYDQLSLSLLTRLKRINYRFDTSSNKLFLNDQKANPKEQLKLSKMIQKIISHVDKDKAVATGEMING